MKYNIDHIDLQYALIHCFLLKADVNIVDISYSISEENLTLQLVYLEGFTLSQIKIDNIKKALSNFNIVLIELYITKEQFNENSGEWQPRYYNWLDYLLFSKAEV